jgi:hypothetical protein
VEDPTWPSRSPHIGSQLVRREAAEGPLNAAPERTRREISWAITTPRLPALQRSEIGSAPRYPVASLTANQVPTAPGVYAWYRDGAYMYIGKASSLRDRLVGDTPQVIEQFKNARYLAGFIHRHRT